MPSQADVPPPGFPSCSQSLPPDGLPPVQDADALRPVLSAPAMSPWTEPLQRFSPAHFQEPIIHLCKAGAERGCRYGSRSRLAGRPLRCSQGHLGNVGFYGCRGRLLMRGRAWPESIWARCSSKAPQSFNASTLPATATLGQAPPEALDKDSHGQIDSPINPATTALLDRHSETLLSQRSAARCEP